MAMAFRDLAGAMQLLHELHRYGGEPLLPLYRIHYVKEYNQRSEKILDGFVDSVNRDGILSIDVERQMKTQEALIVHAGSLEGQILILDLRYLLDEILEKGTSVFEYLPSKIRKLLVDPAVIKVGSNIKADLKADFPDAYELVRPVLDTQALVAHFAHLGAFSRSLKVGKHHRTGLGHVSHVLGGDNFKPMSRADFQQAYGPRKVKLPFPDPFYEFYRWTKPLCHDQLYYIYCENTTIMHLLLDVSVFASNLYPAAFEGVSIREGVARVVETDLERVFQGKYPNYSSLDFLKKYEEAQKSPEARPTDAGPYLDERDHTMEDTLEISNKETFPDLTEEMEVDVTPTEGSAEPRVGALEEGEIREEDVRPVAGKKVQERVVHDHKKKVGGRLPRQGRDRSPRSRRDSAHGRSVPRGHEVRQAHRGGHQPGERGFDARQVIRGQRARKDSHRSTHTHRSFTSTTSRGSWVRPGRDTSALLVKTFDYPDWDSSHLPYMNCPTLGICLCCGGDHVREACQQEYVRCFYCGSHEHLVTACFQLHSLCWKCGFRGHYPTNCRGERDVFRAKEKFERWAPFGLYTRQRWEKPEWGFFRFPFRYCGYLALPFTYVELLDGHPLYVRDDIWDFWPSTKSQFFGHAPRQDRPRWSKRKHR